MLTAMCLYKSSAVVRARLYFRHVCQHIRHNGCPLWMFDVPRPSSTCSATYPCEDAKWGQIVRGDDIVTKDWIMLSGNIGIIVLCRVVWHLLIEVGLDYGCFNTAFILAFGMKILIFSLRCIHPTVLHRPAQSCLRRKMQDHMLHRIKEAWWKDHLKLAHQLWCLFLQLLNNFWV